MGDVDAASHQYFDRLAFTSLEARSVRRVETGARNRTALSEQIHEKRNRLVHACAALAGRHTHHRIFVGVIAAQPHSNDDTVLMNVCKIEQLSGNQSWVPQRKNEHAGVQFSLEAEASQIVKSG